ncbi:MAG: hypothetical protein CMB80_00825 [Flammeovirgaceae bacterium]|jgi:hypothetical protein|nr:hypothetical protein [Flammeovirgaceae bacterium]|tara:strand:+ start:190 stop:552 length:363 start_codon:yes stop_codon:yes gene_type:complete
MIDKYIDVIPIREVSQIEALKKAIKDDPHGVIDPTHLVFKHSEIVGAISLNVACISWWLNEGKTSIRDTISLINVMNALMADNGKMSYILPCNRESPYYDMMKKLGFGKMSGDWGLFKKG